MLWARRPFPLDHRQRDRAGARPHYRWVEADARDAAPGDAAVSRQGSIELLFRGVGRNGSVAGRRTAEDRKRLIRREKFLDAALGDTFHATDPILPMSFVPLKGRDAGFHEDDIHDPDFGNATDRDRRGCGRRRAAENSSGHCFGVHRCRPGPYPRPSDRGTRAAVRLAAGPAAHHLRLCGGNELARVPLQSASDFLLAGGCVLFTTIAVAAASHWLLGFPLAGRFRARRHCFTTGSRCATFASRAECSSPRRLLVILEGEGLANDATALIYIGSLSSTVSAGAFSLGRAAGMFAAILAGEILWGIGVGWLMLRLRRWVRDPRVEIMLSILTPFLALATRAVGRIRRARHGDCRPLYQLERPQADQRRDPTAGYLLLGFSHLPDRRHGVPHHRPAGAPTAFSGIGNHSASELALSAAIVSAVVILTRFIWMYPATYFPRWLIPSVRRKDPSPPWQFPFMLASTGIRGIVSLTAALAIPFAIGNGQPFPHRDLILFLACHPGHAGGPGRDCCCP